jgi:hypothetical protein
MSNHDPNNKDCRKGAPRFTSGIIRAEYGCTCPPAEATCKKSLQVPTDKDYLLVQSEYTRAKYNSDKSRTFSDQESYELHLDIGELLELVDQLRAELAAAQSELAIEKMGNERHYNELKSCGEEIGDWIVKYCELQLDTKYALEAKNAELERVRAANSSLADEIIKLGGSII